MGETLNRRIDAGEKTLRARGEEQGTYRDDAKAVIDAADGAVNIEAAVEAALEKFVAVINIDEHLSMDGHIIDGMIVEMIEAAVDAALGRGEK